MKLENFSHSLQSTHQDAAWISRGGFRMIAALRRHLVSGKRLRADRNTSVANAAPVPTSGIFRILICRVTHSLGNTLLITPLVRELQATYPGAEIDIVTRSEAAADIFGAFAAVRSIYCLPAHAFRHPVRYLALLRRMRSVRYDLVIDPCPQSRTGRALLRLAHGRFKVGFVGHHDASALTHAIPLPASPRHVGQLPVFLLRSVLQRQMGNDYPFLDTALSSEERQRGSRTIEQLIGTGSAGTKRGVIGVFANATPPKLLPQEWWRTFMDAIEAHYSDYAIVEIVPMFGRSLLDSRYPAYYSSSVRKLSSTLSALSMFISADCGIMHLASASGAPTIGIFSATPANEWGPYGPHDRVVNAQGLTPEQTAQQVIA
jgi:heptosyltransferase-3